MVFERDAGEQSPDPALGLLADASLDTPNCVRCLHAMDVDETASGVPFWACGSCGATRVA